MRCDAPVEGRKGGKRDAAAATEEGRKRRRTAGGCGVVRVDRISELPEDVLAIILSLLPIKESARTSVLSRRWRYLWTLCPTDIDQFRLGPDLLVGCPPPYLFREAADDCGCLRTIRTVDGILSRHRGTVRSFRLSWRPYFCKLMSRKGGVEATIDRWIGILAQRGIQSLSLNRNLPTRLLASLSSLRTLEYQIYGNEEEFPLAAAMLLPPALENLKLDAVEGECLLLGALPPAIAACQSLCSLEISGFHLREPFGMQMPPYLKKLTLYVCRIMEGDLLSRVLSTCRLLESMKLDQCRGLESMRINSSSSLKSLALKHTAVQHILIEDVPNLEKLVFSGCRALPPSSIRIVGSPKLQSLGRMDASMKMLQLENTCFQSGSSPTTTNCINLIHGLKLFYIEVDVDDTDHARLLIDMLRCFPCLESLKVKFSGCPTTKTTSVGKEFWEQDSVLTCPKHHLKVVKFKRFEAQPNHLNLARFLARNARMLEVISFVFPYNTEEWWVKTWRAKLHQLVNTTSSVVKVITGID